MIDSILAALFFFVPAGIANMSPILAAKLPLLREWKYPLDGYKSIGGQRIFGDHKTLRGLIAGFIGASLTLILLREWYGASEHVREAWAYVDYNAINVYLWGAVFALGALGGDAIESFFKRRAGKKPGESWFPFDQLDYVIGGLLASSFLVQLAPQDYLVIALIWFAMHPIATYTGYLLGLKEEPI